MNNIIERIEQTNEKTIMPLIYLVLNSSYLATSWNNHDINRGCAPIDAEYHKRLREVSISKLVSLGVQTEKLQTWYDSFGARFESFGIFRNQISHEIVQGTIDNVRLKKLFAKDPEISNDELDRIADEYSDADCAYARKLGYYSCIPLYAANNQLKVHKKI